MQELKFFVLRFSARIGLKFKLNLVSEARKENTENTDRILVKTG